MTIMKLKRQTHLQYVLIEMAGKQHFLKHGIVAALSTALALRECKQFLRHVPVHKLTTIHTM